MITDITLRAIILMLLINKWDSKTIDVDTLFLYAVLEGDTLI